MFIVCLIGQYCQIGTITRIWPRVNIGMFDQNNGERMRATSGSDHVTVGGIRVQPADPATEVGILARHQKELLGDTLIYLAVSADGLEGSVVVGALQVVR